VTFADRPSGSGDFDPPESGESKHLKRLFLGCAVLVTLCALCVAGFLYWQGQATDDPTFFEQEILAFEEADAIVMPPSGGIVFTGSSSIRFWDTLTEDMAPLPVIRRGFGGAHMSHVIHNARRVVTPYAPRAVVVFVGGNDLASGKSVETVAGDFETFVTLVRSEIPEADIWLLSMKPSKLRWNQWEAMTHVNRALEELAAADSGIRYVETGGSLLGPDGKPGDVYIFDGLHLNAEGYRRWTQVLRPQLIEAYGDVYGVD
jgi:hypothetical protein